MNPGGQVQHVSGCVPDGAAVVVPETGADVVVSVIGAGVGEAESVDDAMEGEALDGAIVVGASLTGAALVGALVVS